MMDIGRKYLENEIMTSNPVKVTVIIFEDLIQKLQYILNHFDKGDLESFESDQSIEKLDKAERMIEELHMEIASFKEAPFPTIANAYKEIIDGILLFRENYNMTIIKNIITIINGLKEAYERILNENE